MELFRIIMVILVFFGMECSCQSTHKHDSITRKEDYLTDFNCNSGSKMDEAINLLRQSEDRFKAIEQKLINIESKFAEKEPTKYSIYTNKKTWHAAKSVCESQGGSLVSFESEEEFRKVYFLIQSSALPQEEYWTNGREVPPSGSDVFVWGNGTDPVLASLWYKGEPTSHPNEQCAYMRKVSNYRLLDIPCGFVASYICEN